MNISRKTLLTGLAGILWLYGLIVLYYLTHKPFTAEQAAEYAILFWQILLAVGFISIAGGVGKRLVPEIDAHPLTALALQALLGVGVLSPGITLIGMTLGLPSWMLFGLPVLLLVVFWREIRAWWKQWGAWAGVWKESDRLGKTIAWLCGGIALLSLSVALAPPVKFDALVYHLVLPNIYLDAGRVVSVPGMIFSGMPQLTEMLFAWAIGLGGNSAATSLGWAVAGVAGLGLTGYLYERFGTRAAWVGLAASLAGFSLSSAMAWGYVDWFCLAYGLGCLVCLDQWRNTGERRWLIVGGAFAGFALGSKYTAGVLLLAGLGVLLWSGWKQKARVLLPLVLFGATAVVVTLPWWVKNALFTGNPFYPFLFHAAGSLGDAGQRIYESSGPWGNWLDVLLLPIRATVMGVEGGEGYSASIGPLLLGLGAFSWLGFGQLDEKQRVSVENAAIVTLIGLAVWVVGNQWSGFLIQSRMYFPVFPAFAVLAAVGYRGLQSIALPRLRVSTIVSFLVVLVLGLSLLDAGFQTVAQGAPQMALGVETKEDYLKENLGWLMPAMQAVNDLPDGSKVLLLFEPRSLYCMEKCTPDDNLDRWNYDVDVYQTSQAILQRWQAQGFTHVLFYKMGAGFMRDTKDPHYNESEWVALGSFLNQLPKPVDFGGVYQLYSIQNVRVE